MERRPEREKLGERRGGGCGSTNTGSCPFVGGEKTREREVRREKKRSW